MNNEQLTIRFKPMSFDEWIAANPDVKAAEKTCDVCDGAGCTRDLVFDGEAGKHVIGDPVDCPACSGYGVMNSAQIAYKDQVECDRQMFERFFGSIT